MIEAKNLSKSIGENTVLTNLTFRVEYGNCLGLLGTNGSGKTLLLKILATIEKPTSGNLTIIGHDALNNPQIVRPNIGYVPETFHGYPDLSVHEYLDFFSRAYKLEKRTHTTLVQEVLNLTDIGALSNRKIKSLSYGEKRRLCLAKTFLHDPQVWLLDQPLLGLDARGQIEMKALIQELAAMRKAIVIATNRPTDLVPICSHVAILAQSGLAYHDKIAAVETDLTDLFLELTIPNTNDQTRN